MSETALDRARTAVMGWRVLVALDGLLLLNGLALYFFIETTRESQTIGLLLAAFGALALVVALAGLRDAGRWAWNASWVVPISLVAIVLHSLTGADPRITIWYIILAAIALAGQLMAREAPPPSAP